MKFEYELEAYVSYIRQNAERIEKEGWEPVCFTEFRQSEELSTYGMELFPSSLNEDQQTAALEFYSSWAPIVLLGMNRISPARLFSDFQDSVAAIMKMEKGL